MLPTRLKRNEDELSIIREISKSAGDQPVLILGSSPGSAGEAVEV